MALRIVLDTNTLLRGLISENSAATVVRRAAERRVVIPLLSKAVLDEYRAVFSDSTLVERFPQLTPELIEITLRRLRFVCDFAKTSRARFALPRDPRDEKFLELAINLKATHILSSDNDLLSLASSRTDAGKRFRQRLPNVKIMDAAGFLKENAGTLVID